MCRGVIVGLFNYNKGSFGGDTLSRLRKEGRFAEFILVAWGFIEVNLDHSILLEFGISTTGPQAFYLIDFNFGKKLKLLRDLKYLSKTEWDTVTKFSERRNTLFHNSAIGILSLNEKEKLDVMDLARHAVDCLFDAESRVLRQSMNET